MNGVPVKTIKLGFPFDFGDRHITEVNFTRRPKAKDLKGINVSAMQADDTAILLGRITDLSTPEIEEMDLSDFTLLGNALADFLPGSLKTGSRL